MFGIHPYANASSVSYRDPDLQNTVRSRSSSSLGLRRQVALIGLNEIDRICENFHESGQRLETIAEINSEIEGDDSDGSERAVSLPNSEGPPFLTPDGRSPGLMGTSSPLSPLSPLDSSTRSDLEREEIYLPSSRTTVNFTRPVFSPPPVNTSDSEIIGSTSVYQLLAERGKIVRIKA